MMMTPDVNVYVIDFKNSQREMVIPNEDDTYTIYINARLSHEMQLEAYEHAMKHITENDFDKDNVQEIEATAHEIVRNSASAPEPIDREWLEKRIRKLKRERRKLQKQMQEYDAAMQEIRQYRDAYTVAECSYLYGRGL